MKRCDRSSAPLASGSRASRITQPTASWPQKPANASVGCPPPAWMAPSRSQTSVSGNASRRVRQRIMPKAMSGHSLEKISVPAIARDQPSSAVTTQARRVWPSPTGTYARLPQIELQQLAGAIDGALERPPALEQRPDLAQVVVEDRL